VSTESKVELAYNNLMRPRLCLKIFLSSALYASYAALAGFSTQGAFAVTDKSSVEAQTCAIQFSKLSSEVTLRLDNLLKKGQVNSYERSLIASEMSRVVGTKQEIKLGSQRYLELVAKSAWERREAIKRAVGAARSDYKLDDQAVLDLERRLIEGKGNFSEGRIGSAAINLVTSESAGRRVHAYQMTVIARDHGLSELELSQVKTKFPTVDSLKKNQGAVERFVAQLRTPKPSEEELWKIWEKRADAWEARSRSPEQLEYLSRPLIVATPGKALSAHEQKANEVARYYASFGQYPPSMDDGAAANAYRTLTSNSNSDSDAREILRALKDRVAEMEKGKIPKAVISGEPLLKIFKTVEELDFRQPNSTIDHPIRIKVQAKGRDFERVVVFEAAAWDALAVRPALADGIRRHLSALNRLEVDRSDVAILEGSHNKLFEIPIKKSGAHYRPFGCLKDNVYTIKIVIVAPSTVAGYSKSRQISDLCK
jgi:hypothetical protein